MKENPTLLNRFLNNLKSNFELRRARLELQVLDKLARIGADLITNTFMLICLCLAFFFASLTLGFFVSEQTSSYAIGFGSLTAFYILVAVLVTGLKGTFIEPQLVNFTIRKILMKYNGSPEK
ncbi:hypothetical protein QWY86_06200 [Pedobacter aquatilis]|uniref:hypothetical protein n=1 Tax=Pedobacter aquatilis TaxID=351343 RepID=UPI0025B40820|nr:hypothetical protein [Pedobacter aquatilis]MDN3586250.1 hypothetical protein [Pedobacter aquatilis]